VVEHRANRGLGGGGEDRVRRLAFLRGLDAHTLDLSTLPDVQGLGTL